MTLIPWPTSEDYDEGEESIFDFSAADLYDGYTEAIASQSDDAWTEQFDREEE